MKPWIAGRLDSARRGFLATSTDNTPHIVPIVFVRVDQLLFSPIDGKPKSNLQLRRIRNLEQNPVCSLLIDHYSENWTELWWLRLDCRASVTPMNDDIARGLKEKYRNYESISVGESAISLSPQHWRFWSMDRLESTRESPLARPE